MQTIIEEIRKLWETYSHCPPRELDVIPQSGSNRIYFRIRTDDGSYIATYNDNVRENQTFIYFSRHFREHGCPVPEIYFVNDTCTIYFQEDFGDQSLLRELEKQGHSDAVHSLFRQSLQQLARLQIVGDEGLDYGKTITSREFGKQAILSDLLYYKYFLYRDFQSRNILLKDGQVHFIDFQGGMKGALQYDVASLLWQAKAELSDEWKNNLLQYYITCVEEVLEKPVDKNQFESQYNGYVLIRLLQVLGAYGFRGLFERKAHFLTSIPLALKNIQWFIANKQVGLNLPEFERLLKLMTTDEVIAR